MKTKGVFPVSPLQFVNDVGDDVSLWEYVTTVNGGQQLGGPVARLLVRLLLILMDYIRKLFSDRHPELCKYKLLLHKSRQEEIENNI